MTPTLYGIPNCDTVKKARRWLDARGVAYRFHDWRKDGVDTTLLAALEQAVGWERLLNRAGTTFRALPDADKANLDAAKALALMTAHPAMIRRPVLVDGAQAPLVGFKEAEWDARFG